MRWLTHAVSVCCALATTALLGGCASLLPPETSMLEGRLAVQVDSMPDAPARSFAAPFTLRGNEQHGTLEMSTPLGTMLARATWSADSALLLTADGQRRYATLDAMAQDLFGESLPMGALLAWLRGQPWGPAPWQVTTTPVGFEQLGWVVDLTRQAEGFITATRSTPRPRVTVRARLDVAP